MEEELSSFAEGVVKTYDYLDKMDSDQVVYDYAEKRADFVAGYIAAGGSIDQSHRAFSTWLSALSKAEKG